MELAMDNAVAPMMEANTPQDTRYEGPRGRGVEADSMKRRPNKFYFH